MTVRLDTIETDIEGFFERCGEVFLRAVTEGPQRLNQNPHFAALWDNNPMVRVGAGLFTINLCTERPQHLSKCLRQLNLRLKKEKHPDVSLCLRSFVKALEDLQNEE